MAKERTTAVKPWESMKFSRLALFLEKLDKTASRNEITKILAELFEEADVQEIDTICYLALGKILPSFRGVEFNIAEKMMAQIIAKAYDRDHLDVARLYKEKGDLGDVVYALAPQSRGEGLSVREVYERMLDITKEAGGGSQDRKIEKMAMILKSLDPLSAKYVARIPVGRLRLGFGDVTILDALSFMEGGDKSLRKDIEKAYNVTADIGAIAKEVKRAGVKGIMRLTATPGIPIRPSLAERIPTVEEIIEKLGPEVALEPKLDGFRVEIHLWEEHGEKRIALFSRNLENTTHMFPEIVDGAKSLDVTSVILDGEAIGYNPKTGKFAPFQETVQRKRKYGIEEIAKKIPLTVFVFDMLYINGRSLLEMPFRERRALLENILNDVRHPAIRLVEEKITDNPAVITRELEKNLEAGLEGVVAKKLDAPYEAGSRGFHWVKFKASTQALSKARAGQGMLLDTVDCVVMGAYKGRGKRAGFGVGGFLLGVRGQDGRYYTISKLGTGLSDEQFREAHKRIIALETKDQPKEYVVTKDGVPDIWVTPSLVVEILSDEITLSPRHTAGQKEGRGYSLRFPRLVHVRDDKNPEDATTVSEVQAMYRQQRSKGNASS